MFHLQVSAEGHLTLIPDSVFMLHLLPEPFDGRFKTHNHIYVAMIRRYDRGNLQKTFYFGSHFRKVRVHCGKESSVADGGLVAEQDV